MGMDLNAFTTLADAADVRDLRLALGYPSWNVYGGSYGTRLALTLMRAYPQGIRSAVLDSVFPPQVNFFLSSLSSITGAFTALFQGCAAQVACAAAYPRLGAAFYGLVDRLNAAPVRLTVTDPATGAPHAVLLTGDVLVGIAAPQFDVSQGNPPFVHA